MNLASRQHVGIAYAAITCTLVAMISASGWCWGSHDGTIHDACLFIWAGSGVLLALSQVIFIGVALRMKGDAITTPGALSGTPAGETPAKVAKVLILVFGVVILLAIALFVFALLNMPS